MTPPLIYYFIQKYHDYPKILSHVSIRSHWSPVAVLIHKISLSQPEGDQSWEVHLNQHHASGNRSMMKRDGDVLSTEIWIEICEEVSETPCCTCPIMIFWPCYAKKNWSKYQLQLSTTFSGQEAEHDVDLSRGSHHACYCGKTGNLYLIK